MRNHGKATPKTKNRHIKCIRYVVYIVQRNHKTGFGLSTHFSLAPLLSLCFSLSLFLCSGGAKTRQNKRNNGNVLKELCVCLRNVLDKNKRKNARTNTCVYYMRTHSRSKGTKKWMERMATNEREKRIQTTAQENRKTPKKLWRFTDANNNIHRWVFFFWLLVGLRGFIVLFLKDSLLLSCHRFYAIQIVYRTLLLSLQPISPKIYTFLVSKKQSEIDMLVNHGNHFNLYDYMPTANAD